MAEIQAAGKAVKAAKTWSWVSASWNLIDAKNIQTYARITLQLSLAASEVAKPAAGILHPASWILQTAIQLHLQMGKTFICQGIPFGLFAVHLYCWALLLQ